MKFSISKYHKYKQSVSIANTYLALYPKTQNIYDMRAHAKFMDKDYEGALEDYKTVLQMSGSKFSERDFVRFANLLYLQKKMISNLKYTIHSTTNGSLRQNNL